MPKVTAVALPPESLLAPLYAKADFCDAWAIDLVDPNLSALAIAHKTFAATPPWVNGLLALRDRIVALVGLRGAGSMKASLQKPLVDYRPGDKLGIFKIFSLTEAELILGIDDSHLDVRVSILKPADAPGTYVTATLVQIHNRLGRLYMVPVGRVHPFIVRAMMRQTAA
ncbi:DUF2867 domain-containing protein [Elstera sp.]|jgi:hypothetical protein|uniref:DUF2867 domain-containing protein n=1 Tax=Elstera sp. TaxID=1916664 RepID=UPI0037BE45E3